MLKEVVLGLIQGLTEFLPISSSGHLVIAQHYLNFKGPPLLFDLLLHMGTTCAVLIIFARDIKRIIISVFKGFSEHKVGKGIIDIWFNDKDRSLAIFIAIGTLPTAIIGLSCKSIFEGFFANYKQAALMLLFTGVILCIAEIIGKKSKRRHINFFDALLIGTAQGIAMIPGLSRSGATIATGLLLGIDKKEVARYSFLLSIPAILGATFLESVYYSSNPSIPWLSYIIGTIVAFISGAIAIKTLLLMLERQKLTIFSCYCWVVGIFVLLFGD